METILRPREKIAGKRISPIDTTALSLGIFFPRQNDLVPQKKHTLKRFLKGQCLPQAIGNKHTGNLVNYSHQVSHSSWVWLTKRLNVNTGG